MVNTTVWKQKLVPQLTLSLSTCCWILKPFGKVKEQEEVYIWKCHVQSVHTCRIIAQTEIVSAYLQSFHQTRSSYLSSAELRSNLIRFRWRISIPSFTGSKQNSATEIASEFAISPRQVIVEQVETGLKRFDSVFFWGSDQATTQNTSNHTKCILNLREIVVVSYY